MKKLITENHPAAIDDRFTTYFYDVGMVEARAGLMRKYVTNTPNGIDAVTLATGYKPHNEGSLGFARQRAEGCIRPLKKLFCFFLVNKDRFKDSAKAVFNMRCNYQRYASVAFSG